MLTSYCKKTKTNQPSCVSDIRKKPEQTHPLFHACSMKTGKKRNKTKTYVYNHQKHMNENNTDLNKETAVFQELYFQSVFLKRPQNIHKSEHLSLLPLIHVKHKMEGKAKAAPTGMLKIRNSDF